jgi:hypothetical protein
MIRQNSELAFHPAPLTYQPLEKVSQFVYGKTAQRLRSGSVLAMVKKECGATFSVPSGAIVDIHAIGRGITTDAISRKKSTPLMTSGSKSTRMVDQLTA